MEGPKDTSKGNEDEEVPVITANAVCESEIHVEVISVGSKDSTTEVTKKLGEGQLCYL